MNFRERIMRPVTKNRRFLYTFAIIAIIVPIFTIAGYGQSPAAPKKWTVVIDAGHGGKDPGSLGATKLKEKNIALAVALKTGYYIQKNLPDVKVLYTRDDDTFVGLKERADFANENKADLFISIHANAVPDKRPKGAETWIMGQSKDEENLKLAMKENSVITLEDNYQAKYEGYDPTSVESFIIFSLMQNTYMKQSTDFASMVQDQFRERVGRNDRGVKQAGYVVLWRTTMPSVLIEVGFISNADEEKYLSSTEGQEYMASAIYRSVRKYKQAIDTRSGIISYDKPDEWTDEDKTTDNARTQTLAESETAKKDDSICSNPDNIWFGIQIASSPLNKPKKTESFKNVDTVIVIESGERLKYIAGRFPTYEEASACRKKITEFYPDAFVIAVRGSKIVPLREAIEEKKKILKK